jgi:hypothetical protein
LELVSLDAAGQNIGIRKYPYATVMIMTTSVSKTKRKEGRNKERKKEEKKRKGEGNDTGVIGKEVWEKCRGSLKCKEGP